MIPFYLAAACPRWAFGAGCSEECLCMKEHTLECNARNGTCTCKPGYHGKKCQKGIIESQISCSYSFVIALFLIYFVQRLLLLILIFC